MILFERLCVILHCPLYLHSRAAWIVSRSIERSIGFLVCDYIMHQLLIFGSSVYWLTPSRFLPLSIVSHTLTQAHHRLSKYTDSNAENPNSYEFTILTKK